ncbi:hypothetical protein [uncultured virus]|jgi:thiol-disulfide isomerase/thioredoxin|uniref:Thioredoxin domain-containing protein n=1 Tax=uncultured virus TaxID=340016 RepID=A0A218MM88_9VIRU|nr:hypothetical protein [uncultured virus]
MIKILNEINLQKDLVTSAKLYLYFYSSGCGPCKIVSPLVEEFGKTTNNVVYTIASSEGGELQEQLNVSAYPSMVVVQYNKVIKGGIGQGEVIKIIEDATSNK